MTVDGARRTEILDTAARLIATTGVRTSLREIADACGILPGSLYHHFESKEAIVLELVQRYQAELDQIAGQALENAKEASRPLEERIVALGTEIARCAVRNRAALLLTFYEPPKAAGPDIAALAGGTPPVIHAAMQATLSGPGSADYFRPGVDLSVLADRICQSMLHVGIGVYHQTRGAERVPALKCHILLHGLTVHDLGDRDLDRSAALRAANDVVSSWGASEAPDPDDRGALIRAAARSEFARRGFDVTTIRDIAGVAGISTGTMYSFVDSKDELLQSIMHDYGWQVTTGWRQVLQSKSSPAEQIDALLWFNINVLERFREEHRIQSAMLRQAPPKSPNLSASFVTQLRQVKRLLAEGARRGEFRSEQASQDMWGRVVYALVWTPENIVHGLGVGAAHALGRDTVLRGAVQPSYAAVVSG